MRLFLALELPDAVRDHLGEVVRLMRRAVPQNAIRWVDRANLHVTLKFLGEVPDTRVTDLTQRLAVVAMEPAAVCFDRSLCFPSRGPVRIVGAAMAGEMAKLIALNGQVETACAELGFVRENRPYTPHVTLGRNGIGRQQRAANVLRDRPLTDGFPGPEFSVDRFVLMLSDLQAKGAIYTPIARFPTTQSLP